MAANKLALAWAQCRPRYCSMHSQRWVIFTWLSGLCRGMPVAQSLAWLHADQRLPPVQLHVGLAALAYLHKLPSDTSCLPAQSSCSPDGDQLSDTLDSLLSCQVGTVGPAQAMSSQAHDHTAPGGGGQSAG